MSKKNKLVEIFVDDDSEVIRIDIDGKSEFEGNFWDIYRDGWIEIMQKAGLKVDEYSYQYYDDCEGDVDDEEEEEE